MVFDYFLTKIGFLFSLFFQNRFLLTIDRFKLSFKSINEHAIKYIFLLIEVQINQFIDNDMVHFKKVIFLAQK